MIISDGKVGGVKFVFIHVYKCGGTSVRGVLWRYNSAALTKQHGLIQHASAREVRDKLGADEWARYVSFAVIRNPWDRMVSRYYYNRHIRSQMTLEDYSRAIGSAAYMSQTDFVCDGDGRVLVTHLLRFEHLERDLNVVLTSLGLPAVHLPRLNTGSHPPFRNMYDAASWQELRSSPDVRLWLAACRRWGENSAQECLFPPADNNSPAVEKAKHEGHEEANNQRAC